MTNESLARSYLLKAQKRLKALAVLRDEEAHSDVVREAQELVELALKGTLRAVGIEPPKFHDVGGLLLEHESKFSPDVRERLPRAAAISKRLRRERELAGRGVFGSRLHARLRRGGVGGRACRRGHRASREVAGLRHAGGREARALPMPGLA